MTRHRAPLLLVAVSALSLLSAGCSARRAAPPASDTGCVDATFKGRLTEPDSGAGSPKERRLRVQARICDEGRMLVDVRGAMGGAVLRIGLENEEVRIVLPRERRAATGSADDESLWRQEIGFPFSGRVLRELGHRVESGRTTREVASWRVEIDAPLRGERVPARLEAEGEGGARLVLEKTAEGPARAGSTWPNIPDSFERVDYRR